MPHVIIFHHALGVTPGIESFADELRKAGYRVDVPDLLEGRVFDSIDVGVAYAEEIGFDIIIERGVASATGVHESVVVIGFSLGVLPAQKLAQTTSSVRVAAMRKLLTFLTVMLRDRIEWSRLKVVQNLA